MPEFINAISHALVSLFTVGVIAINGLLGKPAASVPVAEPPVNHATILSDSVQEATTPAKQAIVPALATSTPTPTPTPAISPCEVQIKEILPIVEQTYDDLAKRKESRIEVERCDPNATRPPFLPTLSPENIKNCNQSNQDIITREDSNITAKMNEYKTGLTNCAGQEVKFNKYSSKIPATY